MGGGCCFLECPNKNSHCKPRRIRLFKLPKSPRRRKLWVERINRGVKWNPPDKTYLCEEHFETSQYLTRCTDGWKRLKSTAVPSIFFRSKPQEPAARSSKGALQACLQVPPSSGACFAANVVQPQEAVPAASTNTETTPSPANTVQAAGTPSETPQACHLTQPLASTSEACSTTSGEQQHPQASGGTSATQRSVTSSANWEPAARSSRGALQACLQVPPSSGACFAANVVQPQEAVPAASTNTETTPSRANTVQAAGTPSETPQTCHLTQPLASTSEACSTTSGEQHYPQASRGTSATQRSVTSSANWEPAAETSSVMFEPVFPSPVPPGLTEDVFLQLKEKIKLLENENRRLVRQAALQKTKEETFHSHLLKIFSADQLAALSRSSNRGSKWSTDTVKRSLQMRFACGNTGYDLMLDQGFPLPSTRTLRRSLEAMKLSVEEIHYILDSESEKSDDPDFVPDVSIGHTKRKNTFGAFLTKKKKTQSVSSDESDPDDPIDLDNPQPESSRRRRPRSSAQQNEKKRSFSGAPVIDVQPPNSQGDQEVQVVYQALQPRPDVQASPPRPVALPVQFKTWDESVGVIEPAPQLGEKLYYCCVKGCARANMSDRDGLWLFEMPKEASIMSAWDSRLPLDYDRNRPHSPRVCFLHFEKSDFVRRKQRVVGLREGALPNHPDITDCTASPRSTGNKRGVVKGNEPH